jgi:hypothetical protein
MTPLFYASAECKEKHQVTASVEKRNENFFYYFTKKQLFRIRLRDDTVLSSLLFKIFFPGAAKKR